MTEQKKNDEANREKNTDLISALGRWIEGSRRRTEATDELAEPKRAQTNH